MLNVAVDDEAVACVDIEGFLSVYVDADGAADHVDELMMRVAVASANPTLLEVVAYEHELIGVGEDLALHAWLGGEVWAFCVLTKSISCAPFIFLL